MNSAGLSAPTGAGLITTYKKPSTIGISARKQFSSNNIRQPDGAPLS
jgi:hypothetical protein